MDQSSGRDAAFYLRKVNDCIRYAEEAPHPGLRAYWLELAYRWMQSIALPAQPEDSPDGNLHERTRAAGSTTESSTSELSPNMILPPWSEEQIAAFDDLPPKVRALAFRELASEAKRSAALATDGEQRQTFISSAGFWQRLADMAEQESE